VIWGGTLIKGNYIFQQFGWYVIPYTADYKIKITIVCFDLVTAPTVYCRQGFVDTELELKSTRLLSGVRRDRREYNYEGEVPGTAANTFLFLITACTTFYHEISIVEISNAEIAYGSPVTPSINLPDMNQTDFIKMICNMFGLIPEVIPRDRKIKFWNYFELYFNIPIARDWSAYLSERDDEVEFKFGDYARNNWFHYEDSDDVLKDQGLGNMPIEDETLTDNKDVIELPVSTCDEVTILTNIFEVNVSRIGFNKWDESGSAYESNTDIDPRIVYVEKTKEVASPAYEKTFGIRPTVAPGGATDINSPKKASSLEVSFSYLITYYGSLSRMLTKTNLRRAKFNLPVYEVAGLKHYIPIYLSQYKAYFYVNKINNYVPGQLCTIDLIKL